MAFEYSVSLQIKHPTADPSDIIAGLGRTASHSWKVGEPRMTPKGRVLEGTNRETYCVFKIGRGNDGELAACLGQAVAGLHEARGFLRELRGSGGTINFHVTWAAGERGEVFKLGLLSSIADLGIDLGITVVSSR